MTNQGNSSHSPLLECWKQSRQGLLADFDTLEHNPPKQKAREIRNNKVMATIKEGRLIYINNT